MNERKKQETAGYLAEGSLSDVPLHGQQKNVYIYI